MRINKITKREAIQDVHNQIMHELVSAELNMKALEHEEINSVGINPELSKNITHWRNTVSRIKKTLTYLEMMEADELKEMKGAIN